MSVSDTSSSWEYAGHQTPASSWPLKTLRNFCFDDGPAGQGPWAAGSLVTSELAPDDAFADNTLQPDPDGTRFSLRENSRRTGDALGATGVSDDSEGQAAALYRHVPHRERPPLLVARRNARERRRVQAVNSAFTRLRKVVPIVNARGKRVSKVKTLLTAIDYIHGLQTLLNQTDFYHEDYDFLINYKYKTDSFIDFLAEFD